MIDFAPRPPRPTPSPRIVGTREKAPGLIQFRGRRVRGLDLPSRRHEQGENQKHLLEGARGVCGVCVCVKKQQPLSVATTNGTSGSRRRPAPLPPAPPEWGLSPRVGSAPAKLFPRSSPQPRSFHPDPAPPACAPCAPRGERKARCRDRAA